MVFGSLTSPQTHLLVMKFKKLSLAYNIWLDVVSHWLTSAILTIITWLKWRASKIRRILCCDWLPEQARSASLHPVVDPDLQIRGEGVGAGHPESEIRGVVGGSQKNFSWTFRPHFGPKIRGIHHYHLLSITGIGPQKSYLFDRIINPILAS